MELNIKWTVKVTQGHPFQNKCRAEKQMMTTYYHIIILTILFEDSKGKILNPISLNSFRIKSAQSSERRCEQNYGRIAYI